MTLEPQLVYANSQEDLRRVLGLGAGADVETWMKKNKTEAALRVFDSQYAITMPDYIQRAIEFLR